MFDIHNVLLNAMALGDSQMIGMKMKMVCGNHLKFQIQHIKALGSERYLGMMSNTYLVSAL